MNWAAISFDWNQVRAFLATVEEGSLSGAARALGTTQPTVSRQVAALEGALGVTLFDRGPRVLTLTSGGTDLLAHVRTMAAAAERIALSASGQADAVAGKVTLTATNQFATDYLPPPLLQRLRTEAPGITLDIITSNDVRDLRRREADISIRHARPEDGDLIARQVGATTAHLYAHRRYLAAAGHNPARANLAGVEVIGFESAAVTVAALAQIGVSIEAAQVKLCTNNGHLLVALARAGLGATVLTRDTAERYADLVEVLPGLPPFDVPVWLVTHRELHTSRRIRIVFDLLAEGIRSQSWPAPRLGAAS